METNDLLPILAVEIETTFGIIYGFNVLMNVPLTLPVII